MKALDRIVLVLFAVGLVILFFLRECSLDIYFLVLGIVVGLMSLTAMIYQRKTDDEDPNAQENVQKIQESVQNMNQM
jgi:hypothetical protein